MKLGNFIEAARKAKGLTIEQLAAECGFSPIYLASVERGDAESYTEGTIYTMADRLDLDGDNLLIVHKMIPKWAQKLIIENWEDVDDFLFQLEHRDDMNYCR